MKKHTIYGLLIIVTLLFYISVAPSATAASDEAEVLHLISDYFKAWNTNDNKLMASIHWNSPDFSFFGPNKDVSFLTKGWDETAEGLKTTFEVPVGTYSLTYHEPQVLMLDDNVAIVTLYSIWNINNTDTDEQEIEQIRGTMVVKNMKGKWQIIHVHWSILPTE
jgi:uncharacterized protein (TIGR02246 family)